VTDPPASPRRQADDGFWWGTASSSTQCEGAAPASDWYRWEQAGRAPRSGDGNGFATRYAEDFALLGEYRLTHQRLSLEWARLEPAPGRHDPAAVEHYRQILTAARDAGISTWACLHHFSLPGWFSEDLPGMIDRSTRTHWHRHVDWVAETFGDLVFAWLPINEPNAFAVLGYRVGRHPPGVARADRYAEALEAIHLANYEAWRLLQGGDQPVATAHNLSPVHAATRGSNPHELTAAQDRARSMDEGMWCWTRALRDGVLEVPGRAAIEIGDLAGSFDLIGFSYYSARSVYADGVGPYPADARVGPAGDAPWPEGLGLVLRRLADELPGRPLIIAGCGFGTDDDEWRTSLLAQTFEQIELARQDGLDVRGLFHWTGVDDYEWDRGDTVPFGLFDRDRNARPSADLVRARADAHPGRA